MSISWAKLKERRKEEGGKRKEDGRRRDDAVEAWGSSRWINIPSVFPEFLNHVMLFYSITT